VSTRRLLLIAAIVLGIVLAGIGYLNVQQIAHVSTAFSVVSEHSSPAANTLAEMRSASNKLVLDTRNLMLSRILEGESASAEQDKEIEEINEVKENIETQIASYNSLLEGDEEAAFASDLEQRTEALFALSDKAAALDVADQTEVREINEQLETSLESLDEALGKAIDTEQAQITEEDTLADTSTSNATILAIVSAAAAVVLISVLFFVVIRQLARQEQQEQQERELMRQTNAALQVARDEALAASQMKSDFLASMSHELRTPLNAILNFNEMVATGVVGEINEEQKELLTISLDSAQHLLELINDVLDMSKIQAGMLTLFREENINLKEEIQSVALTSVALMNGKSIMFNTDVDPDLPPISGDKRRIRQILLNLLSNAIKFTPSLGSVTLKAAEHDGEVIFTVSDTGPGVAEEDQDLIFEPFIQTVKGIKHGGGTGLGLPISKWLTEAHGGRIWIESEPGKGAVFQVALPVAPVSVASVSGGNGSHA